MTPRSRLGLALAALVVLVAAFAIAKGSGDSTSKTSPKQITITGGKPVGGVQDITVAKGDRVRFTVTSDVADEIHVHGYDFHKDVTAGGSVAFDFKATIDGKFDIELEKAGEQIASLTVTP